LRFAHHAEARIDHQFRLFQLDIVAALTRSALDASPQVTLVIVASNSLSDLQRREADIAIRRVRPKGDNLIGRLVRESTAHFYASRSWVARNGGSDSISLQVKGDVAQFSRGNKRDGTEIWVDETGAGGVARRACRNQHGLCIS
jgi:DNA-binding transcriptional LysR family regulator